MTKPLILCPDINATLIIKQRETLQFYCSTQDNYNVELWSNLTPGMEWRAFAFTKTDSGYKLCISTCHLPPGSYEFTARFAIENGNWSWYGHEGQNGHVSIVYGSEPLSLSMANVSQLTFVRKQGNLWHFRAWPSLDACQFSLGQVPLLINNYVAFLRKGSCWLTPVAGQRNFDNRSMEKWQILLFQDSKEGNLHLWMAVGQNSDCWLSPNQNNFIDFHFEPFQAGEAHLLIASTTNKHDYSNLVKFALDYNREKIYMSKGVDHQSSQTIAQADIFEKLGYCTWNAFGKSVSIDKLEKALDSLKSNDIPVGYVVIDDGWQQISQDTQQTISFEACRSKFPAGLKQSIQQLKSKYPIIQHYGVWHALWGYWNGIDKQFAEDHNYTFNQTKDSNNQTIGLLKNPQKFYFEFYQFLQQAGVNFVKVDNQGAFQDLTAADKFEQWDMYRHAMMNGADKYFQGKVLHCMSLTPYILFDPSQIHNGLCFRNSDDFFPDEDESHSWHIYANAINSLWTSCLHGVGDWDMFQSDHPFAEYHASSRAISGGPIYITDMPNRHNTTLIQKLIAQTRNNGYTLLRSKQAPRPTFDTVFGNPMENKALLGLYNTHSESQNSTELTAFYGVCGFWNTSHEGKLAVVTTDLFCCESLASIAVAAYVLSGPDEGKVTLLHPTSSLEGEPISSNMDSGSKISPCFPSTSVRVNGFQSSLIAVSHIRSINMLSIACFGLIDKFNGTRAIQQTLVPNGKEHLYEVQFTHRSSACGFWISSRNSASVLSMIKAVTLDDHTLEKVKEYRWYEEKSLLVVDMMQVPLDRISNDVFIIRIHVDQFVQ